MNNALDAENMNTHFYNDLDYVSPVLKEKVKTATVFRDLSKSNYRTKYTLLEVITNRITLSEMASYAENDRIWLHSIGENVALYWQEL